MKYLIAGLGNMDPEYDDTRHNIGFTIVDAMAKEADAKWIHESHGDLATIKHKGRTFILLKPSTYMNLSGKAVRYWMQKSKISQENILVVTDDLNIPFGSIRIRPSGSDGGHNGLKHITQTLGNGDFARMRFGIGSDFRKGQQVNFVLGKWSAKENETLPELITHAISAIYTFGTQGVQQTMNQFTKK